MNTITYKGYTSRVDFDEDESILVGKLLGINDLVSFHADNVADLRAAFHEAVDDYIQACAQLGKTPQKPASGKLMLRVDPSIHSAALIAAQASGVNLNQWASSVLQQAVTHL
jgi:predicted HicB family RNase H-like nuclease